MASAILEIILVDLVTARLVVESKGICVQLGVSCEGSLYRKNTRYALEIVEFPLNADHQVEILIDLKPNPQATTMYVTVENILSSPSLTHLSNLGQFDELYYANLM